MFDKTIPKIISKLSQRKLKTLQHESGLFSASKSTETGYNKAWIRDNIYEALGLEHTKDFEAVKRAYSAMFDILLKHEYKIDHAIKEKPQHKYQYIHARYCPQTLNEFHDDWGNKQNDAVGAFLFKAADLLNKGIMVIRNKNDLRMLQKLVHYLGSVEYWNDKDNGMWEETEEVHASSIGACVAGLKEICRYVDVPDELIKKGQNALNGLLPRESETKKTDLALLSLIYPYNIASDEQRDQILHNIEAELVREKGVIRYEGDKYYNQHGEAEWTFGFPWLAKIYKDLGNMKKFNYYLKKSHQSINWKGELPELYFANTNKHNTNSPLGWSQAMYLAAVS
ncbi:glycoside hydrolase family 15 [Candidatus Woesearchaeota archaeon]|nr:glycoside hydrolase family 15 [Candidatus Woesearchaeota archaeon]